MKVEKFKNLGMILTNQNCMHEEIKGILNSGNSCYHSLYNLFCFPTCYLQTERLKINGIISVCVVLYGCETWSLKVTGRIHTEGVQNRVLRQISV